MGDIGLDLAGRVASATDAVDALLKASHEHAGTLTLVTLGPLTNVAVRWSATRRCPSGSPAS